MNWDGTIGRENQIECVKKGLIKNIIVNLKHSPSFHWRVPRDKDRRWHPRE